MKISIFPEYGALNSKPVFDAFVNGARKLGYQVVSHDLSADVFVIWSVLWHGRMIKNYDIWCQAKLLNKPIIILEVGSLKRGVTWKVGLNHVNRNGEFFNKNNLIPNRSKDLGIHLHSWNTDGKSILICGQHPKSEQWKGYPEPNIWFAQTVSALRKYTDRPIKIRPHPRDRSLIKIENFKDIEIINPVRLRNSYDDYNFVESLTDVWAVVNISSNTGVQSVIRGIPAFVSKESLAYPVGNNNFSKIEDPDYPDRELWLEELCHTEWTLDEINNGIPIKRLTF